MIRFIDIGGQIDEEQTDFAWYDTITNKFIELGGAVVWSDWQEFEDDFKLFYPRQNAESIQRFKRLFIENPKGGETERIESEE